MLTYALNSDIDCLLEILDTTADINERAKKMQKILVDRQRVAIREINRDMLRMRDEVSHLQGKVEVLERMQDKTSGMANAMWYFMKESQRTGHVAAYKARGGSW